MQSSRHSATAVGFAAALALTAAAFALVKVGLFSRSVTLRLVGALAVLQLLIHCRYFLRLEFNRTESERLIVLAFAVLVGLAMTIGTLWIMSDLKQRMM